MSDAAYDHPAPPPAGRVCAVLTGTIPASYGTSPALRHLHLRGHRLSGPLPPLAPGLQLLDVAHNQLVGPFPAMTNATALDYVDVSNNALTGSLPSDLAALAPVRRRRGDRRGSRRSGACAVAQCLAQPRAHDRRLDGAFGLPRSSAPLSWPRPPGYAPTPDLRLGHPMRPPQVLDYLDVSHNSLAGRLDALTFPATLAYADLSSNGLTGQLPDDASGWAALAELRLGNNSVAGARGGTGEGAAGGGRSPRRCAACCMAPAGARRS